VIVDMRCGHRRALLDDDAGQRSDRGAAGRRGMPRPPTHDVALAPGHARHLSPAAATASRRLSKISHSTEFSGEVCHRSSQSLHR
jgi:hypothetical protein